MSSVVKDMSPSETLEQSAQTKESREIDVMGIMERLPHRYPMLMIDRIVDLIPGERATGIRSVSINEPFFQGHFPEMPVMPGVLIVEAMAQTAAVVVVETFAQKSAKSRTVYFMTIEEARFRKPVVPGDQIHIKVTKQRQRGNVWKFRGEAWVGDTLCAEATYSAMLFDRSESTNIPAPEKR